MARTHANALSTEVTQNRMAQRHHLSKALVVSLRITILIKVFVGEKEDPSIIFDTSLIKEFKNLFGRLLGFEMF